MKSFQTLIRLALQNKTAQIAASLLASIAIASSSPARAGNTVKTATPDAKPAAIALEVTAPIASEPNIAQLPISGTQYQTMQIGDLNWLIFIIVGGVIVVVGIGAFSTLTGLVIISEREVGIVAKKFSKKSLPPGRLIALNGESGYQADTLAPGWHWGYWPWQYDVRKESVIVVPQGEIAVT